MKCSYELSLWQWGDPLSTSHISGAKGFQCTNSANSSGSQFLSLLHDRWGDRLRERPAGEGSKGRAKGSSEPRAVKDGTKTFKRKETPSLRGTCFSPRTGSPVQVEQGGMLGADAFSPYQAARPTATRASPS